MQLLHTPSRSRNPHGHNAIRRTAHGPIPTPPAARLARSTRTPRRSKTLLLSMRGRNSYSRGRILQAGAGVADDGYGGLECDVLASVRRHGVAVPPAAGWPLRRRIGARLISLARGGAIHGAHGFLLPCRASRSTQPRWVTRSGWCCVWPRALSAQASARCRGGWRPRRRADPSGSIARAWPGQRRARSR